MLFRSKPTPQEPVEPTPLPPQEPAPEPQPTDPPEAPPVAEDPPVYSSNPLIIRGGSGCEDHNCVWIVAQGIDSQVGIDVRDGFGAILSSYHGTQRNVSLQPDGTYAVSLRLKTQKEIDIFTSRGLRFWLTNPDGSFTKDSILIRKGRVTDLFF